MIGRITTQMTAQNLLANINQSLDRISTTQQELSTGKRINQPSDDPYGTSLALQLNSQLSDLTSYANNVTDGTGWAQASNAALSDITNAVQRIRELVVQAANGTQTQTDMSGRRRRGQPADRPDQAGRQHAVQRAVRLLRRRHGDRALPGRLERRVRRRHRPGASARSARTPRWR